MRYQETHPWLTFQYEPGHDRTSMRLGEAFSKCQHLSGTPLQPGLAQYLAAIYLAKGVNATTAIEGNTLTEADVREILERRKRLPPSQEYLQKEVENVRDVLRSIDDETRTGAPFRASAAWLKRQNAKILDGIDCEDHVVAGEYTTKPLLVGSVYRGAPPPDVPYLVDRMCSWINGLLDGVASVGVGDDLKFVNVFNAAVLGHLYFAWIHPFGDGNGRTARALECAILAGSGLVPWVSSNLLSNHYNLTRTRYYARLDGASREGDVRGFIAYAAEGFVDMLREQIRDVQLMQRGVAWTNYIHEVFRGETEGEASRRRRMLLLALPEGLFTPRSKLQTLTVDLALLYANRQEKAVSHDTNRLKRLGLLDGDARKGYRPRIEKMDAFMPGTHAHT
jgi:Fic family protein